MQDLIIEYCGRYAKKEKITDSTQLEESAEEMSDEDIRDGQTASSGNEIARHEDLWGIFSPSA